MNYRLKEFSPEALSRVEQKIREAVAVHPTRFFRMQKLGDKLYREEGIALAGAIILCTIVYFSLVG